MCERAVALGCQCIQLFSRNPRGWRTTAISRTEAAVFRADIKKAGIAPVIVHAPYLLNLATDEPLLRKRTVTALAAELKRAALLGAQYVVVHAGSNARVSPAMACALVARSINAALGRAPGRSVKLLVENTAGSRGDVGARLEGLAGVFGGLRRTDRVGVCLDTAHLFCAGYDIGTRKVVDTVVREFDRVLGFGRLCLLHLNDTRAELGSGRDRHWHIGEGNIGERGFRAIATHPLLGMLPGVMETPRKAEGDDQRNMARMRRLQNRSGGTAS